MVRVRPQGSTPQRDSKSTNEGPRDKQGDTRSILDPGPTPVFEESGQGSPIKSRDVIRCYVDSKPVRALYLQVRGTPAFLVSEDAGVHEVTRIYYSPSQFGDKPLVFKLGYGDDRLGQHSVQSASLKLDSGLYLELSRGVTFFIPITQLSGNWEAATL